MFIYFYNYFLIFLEIELLGQNVCIFFHFFKFILNWGQSLYNIAVVPAIHQHESATGAHVSPVLNAAPTSLPTAPPGLSQITHFECPTSCMQPALVIHFMVIYMFLPDHPSLTLSHGVQKSVPYICVSLTVLHIFLEVELFGQNVCTLLKCLTYCQWSFRKLTALPSSPAIYDVAISLNPHQSWTSLL